MRKTLILEFDDLHSKSPENCLKTIYTYINLIPDIKLSFFTTPYHSGIPIYQDKKWCNAVRELIESGKIILAVHGFTHSQEEFKYKTYKEALLSLDLAQNGFETARLPYIKVFRGPHWGICQNTYNALIELGYTHVYTHEDYRPLAEQNENKIKSIIYNWNLKDEAPELNTLIGHGHSWNVCQNGIEETFSRVSQFIASNDIEFKFVHEV